MSSVSRIQGGLVNAQREVSRRANAANLPNAIHRLDEEAPDIHSRNETSITYEGASINAISHIESDSRIAGDDIIGECSSPSVTTQDHLETTEKTILNFGATSSNVEDMNEAQELPAQSSADGAQSTTQRVSVGIAIYGFLRTSHIFNTVIE